MKSQDVEEIKAKLPFGSYPIIALMMQAECEAGRIEKAYKAGTIDKMFNGKRTMKDDVLTIASKYLQTINR